MKAQWIRSPRDLQGASPEFRKNYTCKGIVKKATVTATAMGVYLFTLNGVKVGDGVLAPGWTSYGFRVQAQTYDITALLAEENTFAFRLGNGWAVGHIGGGSKREKVFADHLSLFAEITVEYEDGRVETVGSDASWQVYTSHTLFSDLYNGETCDRTVPIVLLGDAQADDSYKGRIVPQVGEWVKEQERIFPREILTTPKGEQVLDFGQNLAGYAEIRICGKRGDRIVLSHGEVLDREGNFYTENMRSAQNRVTYVLSGEGEEVFKPSFTFQGFRYLRLDEWPKGVEIDPSKITAVVIYSDMKRTGDFACGNGKINQLYSNILWGQRGNFIDVPTDCPQRDERLGWTGDAEVFCRTAAINYDTEKFFTKWLGDMMLEQGEDGSIPDIVPAIVKDGRPLVGRNAAAWADAATVCPWEIYLAYGNKDLLRQHFPMMKKWVDFQHAFGEEEFLYVGGKHYGDWLAMDAGEGIYKGATQTDLIASAYFAYSTSLVVRAGKVLGEDVSFYENLYQNVRKAFRAAFMKDGFPVIYPKADAFSTDRPIKSLTQTALVLILRFGLCEEEERRGLIEALAQLIAENGGRMTTGFVGTPHILHVLSQEGRTDLAYDLLLQEQSPSWLFSVNQGATTIWEHWDSKKEDGTFWSANMNSFNHYAYGSVFDWIFGVALGITVDDDGAGYEKITVAPKADPRLGFAKGSILSRRGRIESAWRYLPDGEIRYEITVPEGTYARICLPHREPFFFRGGTLVVFGTEKL